MFIAICFMICYLIIHFLPHKYNSFTYWISFVVEVRHNMRCNHFSYHCLSVNNTRWLINQTRKIVGCKTCHNNVKSDRFYEEAHAKIFRYEIPNLSHLFTLKRMLSCFYFYLLLPIQLYVDFTCTHGNLIVECIKLFIGKSYMLIHTHYPSVQKHF